MAAREYAPLSIPAVLFAATLVLRLSDLDTTCLWFDEIFSIHAATKAVPDLIGFAAADLIHPPLFYLTLKYWIAVGGEQIAWVRGLSVLWFSLALIPAYLLLRELKQNVRAIAFSLSFLIVNGQLFKYSLEVRMYAQLFCLSSFSVWLYVRAVNRGRGWIVLTLVNVLLVYTHYFGWFVVAAQLAAILLLFSEQLRKAAFSLAACFLAFVPWLFAIATANRSGTELSQNISWVPAPGFREVSLFILGLVDPFYFQTSSAQPASIWFASVPLVASLGILLGAFGAFRRVLATEDKRPAGLLAVLFLFPVTSAFLLSWVLPQSIWGVRHLLVVFLPFSVLSGMVAGAVSRRQIFVLSIPLIVLLSFGFLYTASRARERPAWCSFDDLGVIAAATKDQPIYALEDLAAYHLWNATGRIPDKVGRVMGGFGLPEDAAYFLPREFTDVELIPESEIGRENFYLVYRAATWDEDEPPLRNLRQKGLIYSLIAKQRAGNATVNLVDVRAPD